MSGLSKEGHISQITEKTLVPISLFAIVAGAVFWFTAMYAQTNMNTQEIRDIKSQNERMSDKFEEINGRLSNIEGAVGAKHHR